MFTGLIAEVGRVLSIDRTADGGRLRVGADLSAGAVAGDSIAVEGVCLTAVDPGPQEFSADVMNATLERTTLGTLKPGDPVNLELALRAADRLGGHHVQGHVDGVAVTAEIRPDGIARRARFTLDSGLARYVAAQGSITVSGVSLTVTASAEDGFEVSLIPETLERTTLGGLEAGGRVNVEVDLLARYAERLMAAERPDGERGTIEP